MPSKKGWTVKEYNRFCKERITYTALKEYMLSPEISLNCGDTFQYNPSMGVVAFIRRTLADDDIIALKKEHISSLIENGFIVKSGY